MVDDATTHVTRIDERYNTLLRQQEYRWACSCGSTGPWMHSRTRVRNGADMHRANAKVQGY